MQEKRVSQDCLLVLCNTAAHFYLTCACPKDESDQKMLAGSATQRIAFSSN